MTYERSCGAVVFTRVGGIIHYVLVRQKEGFYGFPKGHMEPGETEKETALREIREELGLTVTLLDGFVTADEHPIPGRENTIKQMVYFLAQYRDQRIAIDETELLSAMLVTYEQAMELFQFESSGRILKEANDFLTQPKIIRVDEANIGAAGLIHSESWKESHRGFCSGEFVAKHTPEAQTQYLRREMAAGKALYMLVVEQPVGIVSVQGNLIDNLYVLPGQQNRGWGSRLLEFAMEQCAGTPTLWVMNINEGAYRLYTRWGFTETGNRKQLNGDLYEMELARAGGADDLHRLAVRHIYGNGVQEDDGLAYAPDST